MGGGCGRRATGAGQGSTFSFTYRVPVAQLPQARQREFVGVQPELAGKRVLIVDDNATNRRILDLQTAKWGMASRATGIAAEALHWLRRRRSASTSRSSTCTCPRWTASRWRTRHPARNDGQLPLVLFSSLGRRRGRDADGRCSTRLPDQARHASRSSSTRWSALLAKRWRRASGRRAPRQARRSIRAWPERHPLRILLAEDNVVNQKLALRLLQQMGYRADLASNGIEAVESVQRQTYDVVLMDVQMPEMDGLEAARAITAHAGGASERPRIIAMTANAMQGDRELCLAAGMDDYLTKPIRVERLVEALTLAHERKD